MISKQKIIFDPLTKERRPLLQDDIWRQLGYPLCMGCMRTLPPYNMHENGYCYQCNWSGVARRVMAQGWPNLSANRREVGLIVDRTKRILRGKAQGYKGVDQ